MSPWPFLNVPGLQLPRFHGRRNCPPAVFGLLVLLPLVLAGCASGPADRRDSLSSASSPSPAQAQAQARPAEQLEAWEVLSTRAIQHHWSQLLEEGSLDGPPGGGSVEVECAVDARGRLRRADVVRTTVDAVLTRYCLRAIRDRMPLPPPPVAENAGRDSGHTWRITFVYEHQPRKRR